jgi:hypothetical protein
MWTKCWRSACRQPRRRCEGAVAAPGAVAPHVNAVNAPAGLRAWLTAGGSLTARLIAHSGAFRVQRLHQRTALCLADEARAIGMARPGPGVGARSAAALRRRAGGVRAHGGADVGSASDWPLFGAGRALAGQHPVQRPAGAPRANWNLRASAPATRWRSAPARARRRRLADLLCAALPVPPPSRHAAGDRGIPAWTCGQRKAIGVNRSPVSSRTRGPIQACSV